MPAERLAPLTVKGFSTPIPVYRITVAAKAGIKTVYTRQTPFLWSEEAVTWIRRAMINEKVDHPSKLKPRRLHGSFGWNIMEPFKPGPDDVVIDKRRPSMFVGNEFESIMHNRGATTVVMIAFFLTIGSTGALAGVPGTTWPSSCWLRCQSGLTM